MKRLAVCENVTSVTEHMEELLVVGDIVCVPASTKNAAVLVRVAHKKSLVRRQLCLGAVLCLS